MKFLVLWELEPALMRAEVVKLVVKMPSYARELFDKKKLLSRYHVVGRHGGAWLYEVGSNEELERLLAAAPVYNYSRFQILPLADMDSPVEIYAGQDATG